MALGDNCCSRCSTRDHGTFGACIRAMNIQVSSRTIGELNKWDADLDAYGNARKQGIQPESTNRAAVDAAVEISNEIGRPYDASARYVPEL